MRYSIRELLLLTIVAALVIGWWLDRSSLNERNVTLTRDFQALSRDYQALDGEWTSRFENARRLANLRAMEAWGRLESKPAIVPGTHDLKTNKGTSERLRYDAAETSILDR